MYHTWGDDWSHWDELYKAQSYLSKYVYKWSRCRLSCKEKYGTIRYEWMFPPGGRCFNVSSVRVPFVSKDISFTDDHKIIRKYYLGNKGNSRIILWRWVDSWFYRKWEQYGWYILIKAVKNACIKYPNVAAEILSDLIWDLEGNK